MTAQNKKQAKEKSKHELKEKVTESKNVTSGIAAIANLPKRWLVNIVHIQEKKTYNFNVIIIFALFVALMRFNFEFMLMHRPIHSLNLMLVNFVSFYLQAIFLYTVIIGLYVPDFQWRKTIHVVLIGVFLGMFPPVLDAFINGVGNFSYSYIFSFSDWRLFFLNPEKGLPLGETLVLFSTIVFTAIVIFIKTANVFKALSASIVCYGFVWVYAMLQPMLARELEEFISFSSYYGVTPSSNFVGFKGFSLTAILTLLQIFTTVILYLILNPVILKKLFFRLNHAFPIVLTCLFGFSVLRTIDAYAWIGALLVFYAVVVAIIQNDFFDKEEDAIDGREHYLDRDDVTFFNCTLLLIIGLLFTVGHVAAYMLLLFFVVSVIYNYDFYRAKKYFPANYKIEGVWGLSAFLTGLMMAMSSTYFFAGDILLVENSRIRGASWQQISIMVEEVWTAKTILITFLVFGGWSVLSVIKDYKDIASDQAAGVQTVYTLLLKKNKNIAIFHKIYSLVMAIFMLIPILWLLSINASSIFVLAIAILSIVFFISINKAPSNRTVERSLLVINIYLAVLVMAGHVSH